MCKIMCKIVVAKTNQISREGFAHRTGFKAAECPFMFVYKEFPFIISNFLSSSTLSGSHKSFQSVCSSFDWRK